MPKDKTHAWSVVAARTIETMPDSKQQSTELLQSLLQVMPVTHPQFYKVKLMLHTLQDHERMQRELPLEFLPRAQAKSTNHQ